MTRLTQKDFDALPSTFTLKTARQDLRWQGSVVGLARLLQNNGFAATEPRHGKKRLWIRVESTSEHRRRLAAAALHDQVNRVREALAHARAGRIIAGTANQPDAAIDMAERTLRLVISLRPMSTDMIDRLDELVQRAGPAHARAFLKNFSPDDGVPF